MEDPWPWPTHLVFRVRTHLRARQRSGWSKADAPICAPWQVGALRSEGPARRSCSRTSGLRSRRTAMTTWMSQHEGALVRAEAQVAAVRDDPAARLALMARVFHGPTGRAPRHLPFRRAALSFMRWQARRGVLDPLDASPPRQHVVAVGQRATAAGRVRNRRAPRWLGRRAVVASRAALAGVRCEADGA